MSLKKEKQKPPNLGESTRYGLIYQTRNPWNFRPGINQEAWFLTNLMLHDEIRRKKKHQFKKNQSKNIN
jgi:hypothetical protein